MALELAKFNSNGTFTKILIGVATVVLVGAGALLLSLKQDVGLMQQNTRRMDRLEERMNKIDELAPHIAIPRLGRDLERLEGRVDLLERRR